MRMTKFGISGELCRVTTEDGLELQGFYVGRSRRSDTRMQKSEVADFGPRTAVVHVHGWDGNFYENPFIDYSARACARLGLGLLSGNNRGHDYIADLLRPASRDYVQIGGINERLADCINDIGAWLDFLTRRGVKRIVLQGHSHGAIKAVYYLSKTGDPRVQGIVLLSPSDDLGWARKKLGPRFQWVLSRARELVRAGKGRQLLPEKDFSYPVSAATFFDCFHKDSITGLFNMSRTDREEFPELASIRVPVFLAVGTVEEAFVGSPGKFLEAAKACMTAAPAFSGIVIKGAPHNYLGSEARLAAALSRWLEKNGFDA